MKTYSEPLIVISGAVGFIGSCLVRQLNDCGITNIIAVDDLGTSEKWKNLLGKKIVDLLDKTQLFDWLKGKERIVKAIIHLGACAKTVETDASYLLENNYRYSVHLAEYALRNSIRFIYASSAATYGCGGQGFLDDHNLLDQLRPLNMYGMSKQLFDLWLKNEGVLDKVTGLKFFNVFGPNEYHKGRMASAITHMVPSVKKEGVIKLFKSSDPAHFSDGGQQRDFVYVKDVVRMIQGFLQSGAVGIFNIGSGKPSTWNELAQAVFKAMGHPAAIEYVPMPSDLLGKYQNYTCADMAKTAAALGDLSVCRPLEDAVGDYVCNYLLPGNVW